MTYSKQTWIDGSTPVDAAHLSHIEDGLEAAALAGDAAALRPGYATTLPASPVNGQETILVDNVANPTYTWRFRYNAGSSSPYKWEYVGGAPAGVTINTKENCTASAYQDLATVGPQIVLPREGEYRVEWHAQVDAVSAGRYPVVSPACPPAAAQDADAAELYNDGPTGGTGLYIGLRGEIYRRVIQAGTVKLQYRTGFGQTLAIGKRRLVVTPLRIQ